MTGRGTLGVAWNGSVDSRGGPGWDGGPSRRPGMGRGTVGEARDGSGDSRGVLGQLEGPQTTFGHSVWTPTTSDPARVPPDHFLPCRRAP